jgi:SOS response regulatory protein OraA/RecX
MAKNVQTKTAETTTTTAPVEEVKTDAATIPFNYEQLIEEHKSKSAVIRFLAGQGYKNGPISRFMGIKYQFVRNVLNQPVKKTA